jgi:hypothetical protein
MRRSHDFFDGNKLVSGFFESYIAGSGSQCHDTKLRIHANDCFQSFKASGGCGDYLKGALSYCKFCTATNMKIHQTGVLADFDFRGDENASTRPNEPKVMEQCSAVGERQPMY